jgi:hypothetical protein
MSDEVKLSKPYSSSLEAMMGGFKHIQATRKDWETKEYNFFVVLVSKERKTTYHYSDPKGGSSDGSSVTVPTGYDIRAYCHTHPKRIQTGNFSTADKREFMRLHEKRPVVVWYLMNSNLELRLAAEEKDFPAGRMVQWQSSVTP